MVARHAFVEDIERGLADPVGVGAEKIRPRAVVGLVAAFPVLEIDRIRDRIQQRAREVQVPLELLGGTLDVAILLALLAQVDEGAHDEARLPGRVAHHGRAAPHPHFRAALAQQALFHGGRNVAAGANRAQVLLVASDVLGMGDLAERLSLHLLARVPDHLAEGAVHLAEDAVGADHDEADRGTVERLADEVEVDAGRLLRDRAHQALSALRTRRAPPTRARSGRAPRRTACRAGRRAARRNSPWVNSRRPSPP